MGLCPVRLWVAPARLTDFGTNNFTFESLIGQSSAHSCRSFCLSAPTDIVILSAQLTRSSRVLFFPDVPQAREVPDGGTIYI